jgi:hypothetical protein
MSDVEQWRATCFHEAAHAVFALKVCGFKVLYVSAEESYTAARGSAFVGWAESWRHAMYALAGSFAEQLDWRGEVHPEVWEEVVWEAAEIESQGIEERLGDHFHLVEHIMDMGDDPEENYEIVVQDTENEVRRLWPQITAVAERLLEVGRLEGEECARLIETVHEGEE